MYLINEFHNLSWITEINELFYKILIYWDAPVYVLNQFIKPEQYLKKLLCNKVLSTQFNQSKWQRKPKRFL